MLSYLSYDITSLKIVVTHKQAFKFGDKMCIIFYFLEIKKSFTFSFKNKYTRFSSFYIYLIF